jgi:hypothetical protein
MPVLVWVGRLRPFEWYHRVAPDGDTACGLPAMLYGHLLVAGEALALADKPCPECFTPRQAVRPVATRMPVS